MLKPGFVIAYVFLTMANCFAQLKPEWYESETNGGLCGQAILLFNDSTYCSESGCEGSSRFSFGKWTQKKNIVTLIPADPSKFNFVDRIESEITNEKNLTVMVFDKNGNNITNRILVGQYVPNKGIYSFTLDSSHTKRTDFRRTNSVIVLTSLRQIFGYRYEFKPDSSNLYKIYLNISNGWIFNKHSGWDGDPGFSVFKEKDKLVTVMPDHFDDKGPRQTEFIKRWY